jgi:hypothetical protein
MGVGTWDQQPQGYNPLLLEQLRTSKLEYNIAPSSFFLFPPSLATYLSFSFRLKGAIVPNKAKPDLYQVGFTIGSPPPK